MRINDGDICYDNEGLVWKVYNTNDSKHPNFIYMVTQLSSFHGYIPERVVCFVCRNGDFINVTSGPTIQTHNRKIVSVVDFDLGI